MSDYQKKSIRHVKRQKVQFEETEQVSEPDMAEISELVDQICKTTIIKMPRSLMEKVNSMQEQTGNVIQRDVNSEKDP